MNIGNLTTPVWSMIFDIFLFKGQFKWFYLFAFILQILSIIIFSLKDPIKRTKSDSEGSLINSSHLNSNDNFNGNFLKPLIESEEVYQNYCFKIIHYFY